MLFCKWLSTTWLLIFWLEVENEKPLFTTKAASIWTEISFLKNNFLQLEDFVYTPPQMLLHRENVVC